MEQRDLAKLCRSDWQAIRNKPEGTVGTFPVPELGSSEKDQPVDRSGGHQEKGAVLKSSGHLEKRPRGWLILMLFI